MTVMASRTTADLAADVAVLLRIMADTKRELREIQRQASEAANLLDRLLAEAGQ